MRTIRKVNFQKSNGFTLIETAIAIAVIGLVVAALLMPYNLWRTNEIKLKTDANINLVTAALTNYLIQKGNYPCPARIDAARGDADYGMVSICDPTDPQYPSVFDPAGATTSGTFQSGFYYEDSQRTDADIDPNPVTTTLITPKIRRGSVPFRTLGLAEDQVEDGYGMRLQYAITENLAVVGTYVQESGGISIVDGAGNSLVNPPATAHYVIFSSGKDLSGAYSREGIATGMPCVTTQNDGENCNTGLIGNQINAIYSHAAHSMANDTNHYDDTLKFYSSVETPLWRIADPAGLHIRDLIAAEAGGRVGIGGIVAPTDTVHVAGQVRVENGKSMVGEICNSSGTDCFSTSKFASPIGHPHFTCPTSKQGTGFSNAKIDCTINPEFRCPPGDKLKGIFPDGSLNCGSFTGCPSQNITLCPADNYNLPASLPNTWHLTNPVSGISHQQWWRCQSNGTWLHWSNVGICSCTPVDITTTVSCNSRRPGNWTGTIQLKTETVCPSGTTTYTELSDNCVCDPKTNTGTSSCPSGFTGTKITENNWTCTDADNGSWSGWHVVLPDNYCTCNPSSQQMDFACPAGYTGTLTKEKDFVCPAGTWTGWDDKPPVVDTCTCGGTPPDTRVIGCTSPLVGSIVQHRNYNCLLDAWDPWFEFSNDCGAVTFSLRDKSVPTGPLSGALPRHLGSTCTVPGETVACSSFAGGGKFWHYPVCECE